MNRNLVITDDKGVCCSAVLNESGSLKISDKTELAEKIGSFLRIKAGEKYEYWAPDNRGQYRFIGLGSFHNFPRNSKEKNFENYIILIDEELKRQFLFFRQSDGTYEKFKEGTRIYLQDKLLVALSPEQVIYFYKYEDYKYLNRYKEAYIDDVHIYPNGRVIKIHDSKSDRWKLIFVTSYDTFVPMGWFLTINMEPSGRVVAVEELLNGGNNRKEITYIIRDKGGDYEPVSSLEYHVDK